MSDPEHVQSPRACGLPRPAELALVVILAPIWLPLLLLGLLAVATSGLPLLFRQERVGRGGRRFTLYKLRTMGPRTTGRKVTARDDPRVTPVGRWLRRLKLDEVPQLLNVLRGDMALVGPRPEVPDYVELDDPLWRGVLAARPGITSPMAVHLRNEEDLVAELTGEDQAAMLGHLLRYKLRGHLRYLETRSWRTDLRVLATTLVVVAVPSLVPCPSWCDILREAGGVDPADDTDLDPIATPRRAPS